MSLKLRQTGLGSGVDKDRPVHRLYRRGGDRAHLSGPRRSRQSALFLVHERKRSDDALRQSGDLGGSQGAVSEELGRLEGMGEAGRDPVVFGYQTGKLGTPAKISA
jgi:hypothetical protein